MSEGFVDVLGTWKSLRTEGPDVGGKFGEMEGIYLADSLGISLKRESLKTATVNCETSISAVCEDATTDALTCQRDCSCACENA